MPEEEAVTEEKNASSEKKAKKGLPPFAMLGAIVVVQLVAAWAVAQFMILPRLGEPQEAVESVATGDRGEIFLMDDLVVTLVAEDGTRFLKISPGLECESAAVQAELEERMPEIRDMLINTLSGMSLAEAVAPEGREAVKARLISDLNGALTSGKLLNIYFSDFMVQ